MTYDPSIPQSTDLISNSQADILENFAQLNTQFGIDHSPFYTGSTNGDGSHKQVTLNIPRSDPALTGLQGMVYTKNISSLAQLFFANSSNVQQLTNLAVVTTTVGATGFGITTPWGIKLNWGQISTVLSTSPAVFTHLDFQVPFTTTQAAFAVTNNTLAAPVTVSVVTATGMNLYRTNGGAANDVYFLAIGV